jgi:hypothetical protein
MDLGTLAGFSTDQMMMRPLRVHILQKRSSGSLVGFVIESGFGPMQSFYDLEKAVSEIVFWKDEDLERHPTFRAYLWSPRAGLEFRGSGR